jgi:hypothetical protein
VEVRTRWLKLTRRTPRTVPPSESKEPKPSGDLSERSKSVGGPDRTGVEDSGWTCRFVARGMGDIGVMDKGSGLLSEGASGEGSATGRGGKVGGGVVDLDEGSSTS